MLKDEPTPEPSHESSDESETESDEEEVVHREEAGTNDAVTELAIKMSMDTLKEDEERRKTLLIKEINTDFGDDEVEDEDNQSKLVDKRKLKEVAVKTRTEKESELYEIIKITKISRDFPQPPPSPVLQPHKEKGMSSITQPDTVNQPGGVGYTVITPISDPVNQPDNEEEKDAEGNIIMKESVEKDETEHGNDDDVNMEENLLVTDEDVERTKIEMELGRKAKE